MFICSLIWLLGLCIPSSAIAAGCRVILDRPCGIAPRAASCSESSFFLVDGRSVRACILHLPKRESRTQYGEIPSFLELPQESRRERGNFARNLGLTRFLERRHFRLLSGVRRSDRSVTWSSVCSKRSCGRSDATARKKCYQISRFFR